MAVNSANAIYLLDNGNSRVQKFADAPSDTTAPIIATTTPIATTTNDNTPNYTFTTDEAGTITYGGSCSSATISATVGPNTVTFNTLADGTYSNCTIIVTDAATNASNTLSVQSFTIDTVAPVQSSLVVAPSITTATVALTTNEAATSAVSYGPTSSYGTTVTISGLAVTSHSGIISNLSSCGSIYHYQISTTDAANNTSTSTDSIFVTHCGGTSGGGYSAPLPNSPSSDENIPKTIMPTTKEEVAANTPTI